MYYKGIPFFRPKFSKAIVYCNVFLCRPGLQKSVQIQSTTDKLEVLPSVEAYRTKMSRLLYSG